METLQPSTFTIHTGESSVPETGSETPEDVYTLGQRDEVPPIFTSNETNTEKGATSATMGGETLEMEEEKNSSQTSCCFSTRLLEKMTPKGGRRKMACTIVLVAVLAVVNLIICSLPTILYLITPVSAYFIHIPYTWVYAIPVQHQKLESTQS